MRLNSLTLVLKWNVFYKLIKMVRLGVVSSSVAISNTSISVSHEIGKEKQLRYVVSKQDTMLMTQEIKHNCMTTHLLAVISVVISISGI